MPDINIDIVSGAGTVITSENYPAWSMSRYVGRDDVGIKALLCVVSKRGQFSAQYRRIFPDIGGSLPYIISATTIESMIGGVNVSENDNTMLSVYVEEYGGRPDEDYFSITGVNEEGRPLYAGSV